jgi:hypothetical protein
VPWPGRSARTGGDDTGLRQRRTAGSTSRRTVDRTDLQRRRTGGGELTARLDLDPRADLELVRIRHRQRLRGRGTRDVLIAGEGVLRVAARDRMRVEHVVPGVVAHQTVILKIPLAFHTIVKVPLVTLLEPPK